MSRPTLPERIDAILADHGGAMTYNELASALWPDRQSHRYSSNGGPPGCYMTLSAGLRRGGFFVSYPKDTGYRTVHPRAKAPAQEEARP